jgi:hypothetical protein
MTIRYALSRLSRPDARRAFGRTWLGLCLAGAAATVLVVGARLLFFVAVVWLVCVFAPVRIAIEALHVLGPRIRARMYHDLSGRRDRYKTREDIALMVEAHFGREVHMPRLAPPVLEAKVVEAAARLCGRAFLRGTGSSGVDRVATTCAGLLGRWVGTIAASERGAAPVSRPPKGEAAGGDGDGPAPHALWNPGASIQDQWVTLRAVAGLAALTKVLVAVAEDSATRSIEGGASMRAAAEAAMDYADQIGLRLEGPPWEDAAGLPAPFMSPSVIGRLAGTWTEFCAAPQPAPRRLSAFVDALPE